MSSSLAASALAIMAAFAPNTPHPIVASSPAAPATGTAPVSRPASSASPVVTPAPAASTRHVPARDLNAPVTIHIGTTAVMTIREPQGTVSVAERAQVVQSRIDQVLLHHPYLTWMDVKLLRENGLPTIYWGPFSIIQVDAAHARDNNFSSPDLLAHAWANSMRAAIKAFFAAKRMPERALWRSPTGNVYTYRRTNETMAQPTQLVNTRYIFSPTDFEWGPGSHDPGEHGFVIFIKKGASKPPAAVYLGNGQGTFTQYDWIRPEDTP